MLMLSAVHLSVWMADILKIIELIERALSPTFVVIVIYAAKNNIKNL
jgi:hypothetical protein